ncbi:MAG: ribose 5-phosphate isomerase B [Bdellovibrionales bacterium]
MKKVFVGSDHAGFQFKTQLLLELKKITQLEFIDLGSSSEARVDYPDFAHQVAQKVARGEGLGLLICGSGQGMAITANRYKSVRAAICWDLVSTILARQHNDANILCLGARLIPMGLAIEMARVFFTESFEGGRHSDRIKKMDGISC